MAGFQLGRRLAPPRFVLFLAVMLASVAGRHWMPGVKNLADALALGFDMAATVFLLSLLPLLRDCDADTMRRHSEENDANRVLVLAVTTVLTLVVMAAIAGELPAASGQHDHWAMVRLIGTLVLTWLFANVVYALHYAHAYYTRGEKEGADAGGLDIPGTETPDYLDFIYFSFTLGMTFQTSDIEISGRQIRRVATLHSLAAFIFNIGVIAFTINALGGSSS